MMKKLGLLSGVALVATALLPLAGSPAGATTMTHPGPIFGQVTGTPGDYYCFGAKATITDARTTFYTYETDHDGTTEDQTEYVYGGPERDTDYRDANGNEVFATFNVYYGTPGDDVIIGTAGRDEIWGEGGRDKICSLDGNDRISTDTAASGWVQVDGGRGDDVLSSYDWRGVPVTGTSYRAYGGPGNDTLIGSPANDYLDGGVGTNVIDGFGGDDFCFSGKNGHANVNQAAYPTDPRAARRYYGPNGHTPLAVNYNCEHNFAGRGWTNHAMFYPATPVTTTTTTRPTTVTTIRSASTTTRPTTPTTVGPPVTSTTR
jgi:hypothetical protein